MPRVNTLNTQREQTTIRLPKELKIRYNSKRISTIFYLVILGLFERPTR